MTTVQYQQHVEKEYQTMRDRSTKKRVADRILGVDWSLGLKARQVADLDLAYYQEHAHLKTWKVLRLDSKDQGLPKEPLDASHIEKTLTHHLSPYFNNHVQAKQDKEMIWIRISLHDGLAPNTLPLSSTIIYLIWFTNSEYLLSGTIKAEWKDFILAAILRLFRASEAEEWPLSGKSPLSLAELLLTKESQGAHSRYRLNQLDENPLSQTTKKRKKEDPQETYAQGMQDIRAVDIKRIVRRDHFVASNFGPNAQPSLSRVDLQLRLPFTLQSAEFTLGRLTKQPFLIKITMEGSNVIDGLKNMIPLGLNTSNQALPPFLSELHSMATNSLTVDLEEGSGSKQRITKGD
ncbi:hypothetical protein BGZ93_005470 [Podila epicladia]|nr:hypothetical protein BGZ92_004940 [Podila epicladia]KAG0099866.1 hypothetical protein BGZ93_005470 [Podila epicladia]